MKRAATQIPENQIANNVEEVMSLEVGNTSSTYGSRTGDVNNDPTKAADAKDNASSSSSPATASAKGLIPDDVVKSARNMFQASGVQPKLGAVPGEEGGPGEPPIIVAGRCRGGGVCR